jgi:hypothetical protein
MQAGVNCYGQNETFCVVPAVSNIHELSTPENSTASLSCGGRLEVTDEATAYHEAGHAVMAVKLGQQFEYVTLKESDDSLGHIFYGEWMAEPDFDFDSAHHRDELYRRTCVILAGAAAESDYTGGSEVDSAGATGDREGAIDFAFQAGMQAEETEAWINWIWVRMRRLVQAPTVRTAIIDVATALRRDKTLTHAQCAQLCNAAYVFPEEHDG